MIENDRYSDLANILSSVSEVTGIPIGAIKSNDRTREVTQARHIYCYLAREKTGRSIEIVGSMVNLSRVATLQAIRKIKGFIDIKDPDTTYLLSILVK